MYKKGYINQEVIKEFEELSKSIDDKKIDLEEFFRKINALDKKFQDDPFYKLNINGMIINLGKDLNELRILYFSLERLMKYLENTKGEYQNNKIFYDIGNAYHTVANIKFNSKIGELKRNSGDSEINNISLLMEIDEYSKAIEYLNKVNLNRTDLFFRAKTDYCNILDKFGRYYESIMLYERILKIDGNFGMALGNKAGAIIHYYEILPDKFKFKQLLIVARDLLEISLKDERLENIGGKIAIEGFGNLLNSLNEYLSRSKNRKIDTFLGNLRKYIHVLFQRLIEYFQNTKIRRFSKSLVNLRKYQKFVLDKNLFLNFHFGFNINKNSLKDIVLPPFFSTRNSGSSLKYHGFERNIFYAAKHLNQIIEDFTSARYLYFLATNGEFDNAKSDITEYIYTLDYTRNNLEYGILKTIFTKLFNVLDKIANFLYTYFEIEHSGDIYFRDLKNEKCKELVKELNNPQILALFEMSLDFQEGYSYYYLREFRNNLIHKFLDITEIDGYEIEDEEYKTNYLYKDKFSENIQLMFEISKAAILYTVLALETERDKIYKKEGPIIGSIKIPRQSDIFSLE